METQNQISAIRAQCAGRQALPVRLSSIPTILAEMINWIVWGNAERANAAGKLDKKPYSAITHRQINPTDPSNWSDLSKATGAYMTGRFSGIGISLSGQPVGTSAEGRALYLHAVDVDNIFQSFEDSTSQVDERLMKLQQLLGPVYLEFSPSGVGARAFFLSTRGPERGCTASGYEWYTQQRYLTVTGQRIGDVEDLTEVPEHAVEQFVYEVLRQNRTPCAGSHGKTSVGTTTTPSLDIGPMPLHLIGERDEVLRKLLHGPLFAETTENKEQLYSALRNLDPDVDDNQFYTVRKALKDLEVNHDWTSAREVARKWARGDFWKKQSVLYYQDEKHQALSPDDADHLFDKRWVQLKPEANGNDIPFRKVLELAEEAGWSKPTYQEGARPQVRRLDLNRGRIDVSPSLPPPPRYVVGSFVAEKKVTILGGLGGVSKTTLICQLATSVALGESFGDLVVAEGGALLLLGEDDDEDKSRRFKAILRDQLQGEKERVVKRLRALPMAGIEMKLTQKNNLGVSPTSLVSEIVDGARQLEQECGVPTKLIVLDNIRLAMAGDTNSSEEAASVMTALTDIASQTEAAVVVLGHSPKTLIGKLNTGGEPDAADIIGSMAFVNSARAAALLSAMTKDEAKVFSIASDEEMRSYVKLTIVKSNIGPTGGIFWYRRVPVAGYGTSLLEPVNLQQPVSARRNPTGAKAALRNAIVDLIRDNGAMTINQIKPHAAKSRRLKASQAEVFAALDDLQKEGIVKAITVDATNRANYGARVGTNVLVVDDPALVASTGGENKR